MTRALVNPLIQKAFDQFRAGGAHALMLSGSLGGGKGFLLHRLTEDILEVPAEKAFASQSGLLIQPLNGSIGIDTIRALRHFLQLRTTGQKRIRRVVVIEDAETMTTEAQNALLKILEEPPLDTVIMLTVNGEDLLGPTVYSRVQNIKMRAPTKEAVIDYFKGLGHEENKILSIYHLSDGQIGMMHSLLGEEDNPLIDQLAMAKNIITANIYERLALVDSLAKDKGNHATLLFALRQVSRAALLKSLEKGEAKQIKSWHRRLQAIHDTEALLPRNPNGKLLLSSLMLSL